MTSKTTQAGNRRIAPLARVVALLLLALVTHSATIEIVHQHGKLLPALSKGTVASLDVNTDHTTPESSRPTGECLICQLHENLFSTLLINIPGIAPPEAEEAIAGRSVSSSPTQAHSPRRGRAPPQAFLL